MSSFKNVVSRVQDALATTSKKAEVNDSAPPSDTSKKKLSVDELKGVVEDMQQKGFLLSGFDFVGLVGTNISRSGNLCVLCGKDCPGRVYGHYKSSKHNEVYSDEKYRQAVHYLTPRFNHAVSFVYDCAEFPFVPSTDTEFAITQHFLLKMKKENVRVINEHLIKKPITSADQQEIQRIASSLSAEISSLRRDFVYGETQRPSTSSTVSIRGPKRSAAEEDISRPETASADAILEEEEELFLPHDSPKYKLGITVPEVYMKAIRTDLAFQHKYDIWKPNYISGNYRPKSDRDVALSRSHGIFKKLNCESHAILMAFSDHLRQSGPESSKTKPSGIQMYAAYVERFMLITMRASQRFGEEVTLDDCLFSYRLIYFFFKEMKTIGVSVHVRLNFAKSLRRFQAFLATLLEPTINGRERNSACKLLRERCINALNATKRDERSDASMKGTLSAASDKDYAPYCLGTFPVFEEKVVELTRKIVRQSIETKRVMHSEYNFVMGHAMAVIVQLNATRNEACYKLRNGGVIGDGNDTGTGLQEIKMKDRTFYVGCYPKPKQASLSKNGILRGLFVLTDEGKKILQYYLLLKKMRAEALKKNAEEVTAPVEYFFVKYNDLSDLGFLAAATIMRNFYNVIGLGKYIISCNQARHAVAQLDFDNWVETTLTNAGDLDVARHCQHSLAIQNSVYTQKDQGRAVMAFMKLRDLERRSAKEHEKELKEAKKRLTAKKFTNRQIETLTNEDDDVVSDASSYEDDVSEEEADDQQTSASNVPYLTSPTKRSAQNELPEPKKVRFSSSLWSLNKDGEDDDDDQTTLKRDEYEFQDEPVPRQASAIASPIRSRAIEFVDMEADVPMPFDRDPEQWKYLMDGDIGAATLWKRLDEMIIKLNHQKCEVEPPSTANINMKDFGARRNNRPIQDFPWLKVCDAGTAGKGLFAKVTIKKERIVCDYRGKLVTLEAHRAACQQDVDKAVISERTNYFFEHTLEFGKSKVTFGIEAHRPIYCGRAVLGRYINHSRIHPNVVPRIEVNTSGVTRSVMIIFVTTKEVQAGEQLLFDYGKHFNNEIWYDICMCRKCQITGLSKNDDEQAEKIVKPSIYPSLDEAESQGISMSQSLITPTPLSAHARTSPLFWLNLLECASGSQLCFSKIVYQEWKAAYEKGRATFGLQYMAENNLPECHYFSDLIRQAHLDQLNAGLTLIWVVGGSSKMNIMLVIGDDKDIPACLVKFDIDRHFFQYATPSVQRNSAKIGESMKDATVIEVPQEILSRDEFTKEPRSIQSLIDNIFLWTQEEERK